MRIADAAALDAALLIFAEKSSRIVHQKAQSNVAHLVLVLELHVDFDLVTAESNVIWCVGVVLEGELKAKSLGIEVDGAFDVACADNRIRPSKHGDQVFPCKCEAA